MSDPPKDRAEFWIRFVCSFMFFGLIVAICVLRCVDSCGLPVGIAVWAVATFSISLYAAMAGDEAWHNIISFLRWGP